MLFIPLIYFILLATYFYMKHRCLNLDIAATLLLVVVSIFSIIIFTSSATTTFYFIN